MPRSHGVESQRETIMHRRLFASILLLAACMGGCGVRGHWAMTQVQPGVGNESFTLARASFYANGSFEALAIRDGQTLKAKGTYEYCACRNQLTLHTGQETRVYEASRVSCNRLHVTQTTSGGEPVTVVLRRVERCDRNAECRGASCCCCR